MKNNQHKGLQYLIGIDPGSKNRTGLSVYSLHSKRLEVVAGGYHHEMQTIAIEWVNLYDTGMVGFVIEAPAANSNVFHVTQQAVNGLAWRMKNGKASANQFASQIRKWLKIAQGVGANAGLGQSWIDLAKWLDAPLGIVPPSDRTNVSKAQTHQGLQNVRYPSKMKAGHFKQLTGWEERTNEHERDAAMLVWGMNRPQFSMLEQMSKKYL